jgi:hypothetical protein
VYKGCAPLRFFILLQLLIKKKKKMFAISPPLWRLFPLSLLWIGLYFVLRIFVLWWEFRVRRIRIKLWLSRQPLKRIILKRLRVLALILEVEGGATKPRMIHKL